jgi:hypothetical protein
MPNSKEANMSRALADLDLLSGFSICWDQELSIFYLLASEPIGSYRTNCPKPSSPCADVVDSSLLLSNS